MSFIIIRLARVVTTEEPIGNTKKIYIDNKCSRKSTVKSIDPELLTDPLATGGIRTL